MSSLSRLPFSKVRGKPLLGGSGAELGSVVDGVVKLVDGSLPTLTGLLARVDGKDVFVPVADLVELADSGARVRSERIDAQPFERRPGEVLLENDVQGRSVIDVEDARLVRVDDLLLEHDQGMWRVASIVPAPPSRLLAALGMGKRGVEIDWSNVEPLVGHVPSARQRPSPRLAKLRPADIADIVEEASHDEGEEILDAVHQDHELEADVFEELDEEHRLEFIEDWSNDEVAGLLANMDPDDAADLLMELDQERRRPILELLPREQQTKVMTLLGYNPETAGGLMSNEFIAMPAETAVSDAIAHLRGLEELPDKLTELYTLDGDALCGALSLAELIHASPEALLRDLAPSDPVAVYPDADLPAVAVEMADYNLTALPVVDHEGHILGVITFDDVIEAMIPEEWRWRGGAEHARLRTESQG